MTPQEKAFLDLIAWSEGTSTHPLTKNNGYDVIVNGPSDTITHLEVFTDYSDHPFAKGRPAKLFRLPDVPGNHSTASGRYQLLLRYWRAYQSMLHLPDFSPASQDAVALRQMTEQGALKSLEQSDVENAIYQCANIWASLPGNTYGQGGHSAETLLAKYQDLSSKELNT